MHPARWISFRNHAFSRVPTCDAEDPHSSESGCGDDSKANGCTVLHHSLLLSCALSFLVGVLTGRYSVQGLPTTIDSRHAQDLRWQSAFDTSDLIQFDSVRKRPQKVQKLIAPNQYLATFSTELSLVNVSKKGDGWAPWQLAVSGNAAERGGFCERSHHLGEECPRGRNGSDVWKNPNWVAFNVDDTSDESSDEHGVWALYIDPEKELAPDESYQDEEVIETRFQITLTNRLEEPTLMHFHGLVPPNNLDGIPFISANPIQPNTSVFYDFIVYHRGFYWMHSHFGHHAGSGLFAPLIIKDHPDFLTRIGHPRDVLMIIVDAHWRAECAYARHLYPDECPVGGFDGWEQYTFNVNGRSLLGKKPGAAMVNVNLTTGKMYERPIRLRVLDAGTMAVYRVSLGSLRGRVLATDGRHVRDSKTMVSEFPLTSANRVDILINITEEGCYPIEATRSGACDNPSNTSERAILILKTPKGNCSEHVYRPYAEREIQSTRRQEIIDFQTSFTANNGLTDPHKKPDVEHKLRLTGKYHNHFGESIPDFTLNHSRWRVWPHMVWCRVPECKNAVECKDKNNERHTVLREDFCQGESLMSNVKCEDFKCGLFNLFEGDTYGRCLPKNGSDKVRSEWSEKQVHVTECHLWKLRPALFKYNQHSLEVCHGDRVWITYTDDGTMEAHPVHLHGTHTQLIMVDGKNVTGPMQDTWFAYKNSSFTVAFDALNPGEWLLHCHIEHHLMNGMATTLRYMMDGRCRKRLDGDRKPTWRYNRPVSEDEWPADWHALWMENRTKIRGFHGWITEEAMTAER